MSTGTDYWRDLLYSCNPEDIDWKYRVTKLTNKEVDDLGESVSKIILYFDWRQIAEALRNISIGMMKGINECYDCKHQHTMECPSSSFCYATRDKPYFVKRS